MQGDGKSSAIKNYRSCYKKVISEETEGDKSKKVERLLKSLVMA